MDNFWFWAKLAWDVGCAWFDTWPAWVQVLALLFMVYALLWLLYLTVSTPVRVFRWARGLRRPRMALAQKQALERILVQALEVAEEAWQHESNPLSEDEMSHLIDLLAGAELDEARDMTPIGEVVEMAEMLLADLNGGQGVSE